MTNHPSSPHAEGAHTHHWEISIYPFILAVGILLLVPLAFSAWFVYKSLLLAVLFAGIGTPLLLWGVSGWIGEGMIQKPLAPGLSVAGLPVFIVSEILIFLSIFAAYWTMRLAADMWPPAGTPTMPFWLPIFMTIALVTSSITMHIGEERLEYGNVAGFRAMLLLTIALGVVFLGCTLYEYSQLIAEGFTPNINAFSTVFYSLTGFHAAHVLVGACVFVAVLLPALSGKTNAAFVKCASIYWHFVDVVWLFVVSQIYFW